MAVIGDLYNVVTEVKGAPNTVQKFTFSLRNAGNQAGVITVELYDHNENLVASKDFYLEPNQSVSSYLEATLPSQPGQYTWYMQAVASEPTDYVEITVIVEARSIGKFVSVSPTKIAVKPSEQITIEFTIQNTGYDGNIYVQLKDQNGNIIVQRIYYLLSGNSTTDSITFNAPSNIGTYTYTLEAYGTVNGTIVEQPDDSVSITVEVGYPHFTIIQYPDVVSALPGQSVDVTVRVLNDGVVSGTVKVELYDENGNLIDYKQIQLYAGVYNDITFTITAPQTIGYHTYTVKAYNIDTDNYDDEVQFYVKVVSTGTPIADITQVTPTSITAKPSETIGVYVEVKNTGDVVGDIVIQLLDQNGNIVDSESFTSVSPGETRSTELYGIAPSRTGTYTWKIIAFGSSQTEPDDSVSITITVSVNYGVTITSVDPSYIEGKSGDRVTVTWWVRNDSDVPATIVTMLLDNNNNKLIEYSAELSPGESTSFTYTITLPEVDKCTQMSYYVMAKIDTYVYDEKSIGLYVCPREQPEQPGKEEPFKDLIERMKKFMREMMEFMVQMIMIMVVMQLMTYLVSSIPRMFRVAE